LRRLEPAGGPTCVYLLLVATAKGAVWSHKGTRQALKSPVETR
jgi:hypothetical protein